MAMAKLRLVKLRKWHQSARGPTKYLGVRLHALKKTHKVRRNFSVCWVWKQPGAQVRRKDVMQGVHQEAKGWRAGGPGLVEPPHKEELHPAPDRLLSQVGRARQQLACRPQQPQRWLEACGVGAAALARGTRSRSKLLRRVSGTSFLSTGRVFGDFVGVFLAMTGLRPKARWNLAGLPQTDPAPNMWPGGGDVGSRSGCELPGLCMELLFFCLTPP